jgi:hypothetical protein
MNEFLATDAGGEFEILPAGDHIAFLAGIANMGHVTDSYLGTEKITHKIALLFELPNQQRGDGNPYTFTVEFTFSMDSRSNFRKNLEKWRGKPYTEDEAKKGVDISKLLANWCTLEFEHKVTKAGKTIAVLDRIKPKGNVELPQQRITPFLLGYNNFDWDHFAMLPSFIQDKMKTSRQYQEMVATTGEPVTSAESAPPQAPSFQSTPSVPRAGESMNGPKTPKMPDGSDLPF